MGKVVGILFIAIGFIVSFLWPIPYFGDVSPLGVTWNTVAGALAIIIGIVVSFSGRRR